MKKLLTVSLLTLSLFACAPLKNYPQLSLETKNIADTMANYFNLDTENFKGSVFQAKALDIIAVPFPLENSEVTHYIIDLIIAPITEMPFEIKSISVRPVNQDVYDYFTLIDMTSGYGNLDDWNFVASRLTDFKFPLENNRFTAYQYNATFNNRGISMLEKHSMSLQLVEEGLKEFEIVIKYNNSTDIIKVSNISLTRIQSLEDVDPNRTDILELINTGSTSSFLAPFR
ncbi:MAG: hypothetical protein KGZ51_01060 [Erysipelothrix sp.]|jgi:hypothetical protein|nr:hypothetical protein [Erysipelothrix sp.]